MPVYRLFVLLLDVSLCGVTGVVKGGLPVKPHSKNIETYSGRLAIRSFSRQEILAAKRPL